MSECYSRCQQHAFDAGTKYVIKSAFGSLLHEINEKRRLKKIEQDLNYNSSVLQRREKQLLRDVESLRRELEEVRPFARARCTRALQYNRAYSERNPSLKR
jgi:hypothetical protein